MVTTKYNRTISRLLMRNERSTEILLAKGYGYPLWSPKPSELPVEHRENGVRIGDVGFLTDTGSFLYFFNICVPRDDPSNSFLIDPAIEADTLEFKTVTMIDSTISRVAKELQDGDCVSGNSG